MKVLIYFLLISSTHQLSCISRKNLNFSVISVNTVEFQKILQDQKIINKNATLCRIELKLSYTEHDLEVIFDPIHPTNGPITVGHSRLETIFTLDSQLAPIVSVLIHKCSTKDACDRDFVLNRFFWLLNQDYVELHQKLIELLIKEKNLPTYCIEKSSEAKLLNCNDGICVADMHSIKDPTPLVTGGCGAKKRNSTITRIITNPNESDRTVRHDIFYTCMFHGCNNITTAFNLINIVHNSYNVSKIIYGGKIDNNTLSNTIKTSTLFNNIYSTIMNSTSTIDTKEITLTTIFNRSFTTSIVNTAIQDFQTLSILIKINFSVLLICFRFLLIYS